MTMFVGIIPNGQQADNSRIGFKLNGFSLKEGSSHITWKRLWFDCVFTYDAFSFQNTGCFPISFIEKQFSLNSFSYNYQYQFSKRYLESKEYIFSSVVLRDLLFP